MFLISSQIQVKRWPGFDSPSVHSLFFALFKASDTLETQPDNKSFIVFFVHLTCVFLFTHDVKKKQKKIESNIWMNRGE